MPSSPHTWCAFAHAIQSPSPDDRRGRTERGFGLIEIIIVCVILAILMAVTFGTMRGSKRTGHYKAAQAAAMSYADAIEAYMADNGQTPPTPGTPAWPDTSRGPVDAMLRGKPYMRSVPEAVTDGLVEFAPRGMPAGTQIRSRAALAYTSSGANYFLHVRAQQVGDEPPLECVVTNAGGTRFELAGSAVPAC